MNKRRVVVTGLGAVTPVGNNVEAFWESVKAGKVGIGEITKFDTADFKVKLAAEVKDFNAKDYMDFKSAKRMELFSQYAVAAAKEAMTDARIDMEKEDPFRVGVIVGSGIGSLQAMENAALRLAERGPSKVDPLLVPKMISNMAAGNVSIATGARGKCTNVVTACASGTHCIGDAYRAIQYGDAEVMLAGGTEGAISPVGVAGFTNLTALSTSQDPYRASIPFDKDRGGFVIGEGAGVVVLEELEHAKARNAKIYAEVVGYGATADAYHITSPIEDGSGAARAMTDAMKEAGALPEEIDYINAHGTGTKLNDVAETKAYKIALGDYAYKAHISSIKCMTGHMFGAAGAAEAITTILALNNGIIPPTINLDTPDPECDLDYTPNTAVKTDLTLGISDSLGFGGHNACIAFRKYEE